MTRDEPTLRIGNPPTSTGSGTRITVVQTPPARKRPSPWLLVLAVALIASSVTYAVSRITEPTPKDAVTIAVDGFLGSLAPDDIYNTGPRPTCGDAFADGRVFTAAAGNFPCLAADGTRHFIPGRECTDGRRLFSVDKAITGTTGGWGFSGDRWHAVTGDVAGDPGFSKAYNACLK